MSYPTEGSCLNAKPVCHTILLFIVLTETPVHCGIGSPTNDTFDDSIDAVAFACFTRYYMVILIIASQWHSATKTTHRVSLVLSCVFLCEGQTKA